MKQKNLDKPINMTGAKSVARNLLFASLFSATGFVFSTSAVKAEQPQLNSKQIKVMDLEAMPQVMKIKKPVIQADSAYDIITVGGILEFGPVKVRLGDVGSGPRRYGYDTPTYAIVDILDSNSGVVDQAKITEQGKYIFTHGTQNYALEIGYAAGGFTPEACWAEVSLSKTVEQPTLKPGFSIVNIGEDLKHGNNFSLRLSDISAPIGMNGEEPAIVEILDANDAVIRTFKVNENGKAVFEYDGKNYEVDVYQTALGNWLNEKWAKIKVNLTTEQASVDSANVLNIGSELHSKVGNFTLRIADISTLTGTDMKYPAIVQLLDSNEKLVDQFKMPENGRYIFAYKGQNYAVEVGEIAAGATLSAKWAKISEPKKTSEQTTEPIGSQSLKFVSIGGAMGSDDWKVQVRLSDLSIRTNSDNQHMAIFDIIDKQGNTIDKCQVPVGGRFVFEHEGQNYAINVSRTALGFTLSSAWAKMNLELTNDPITPKNNSTRLDLNGYVNTITAGKFKIRLVDIGYYGNVHPAILDVLDSNYQVIGQIQVTPGDTYTFTQSSTGDKCKVHVYQTAPGATLHAKWADVSMEGPTSVSEPGHEPGPAFNALVYPNPAQDYANLKLDIGGAKASIRVYGINGQEALPAQKIDGQGEQQIMLDVTQLASGKYSVFIYDEKGNSQSVPLVISR